MASQLDHPLLAARYFFPRRDPIADPHIVVTRDGVKLACYRAAPHPGALTVLHFHGNAEIVSDYVPGVASLLTKLGVNAFFAEYRGYGGSTGAPTLGAMLEDAEDVFQAVGAPPERVVAFGRSLGSLFAAEVASRHPTLAGLVLESAIADPLEPSLMRIAPEDIGTSLDELRDAVHRRVDQRAKLEGYKGPLLVLHAAADQLIPRSHGERLHAWGGAPAADKTLVMFDVGDHGSIFPVNRTAYLAHLAVFLAAVDARSGRVPTS